jgi:hypothetical protein
LELLGMIESEVDVLVVGAGNAAACAALGSGVQRNMWGVPGRRLCALAVPMARQSQPTPARSSCACCLPSVCCVPGRDVAETPLRTVRALASANTLWTPGPGPGQAVRARVALII